MHEFIVFPSIILSLLLLVPADSATWFTIRRGTCLHSLFNLWHRATSMRIRIYDLRANTTHISHIYACSSRIRIDRPLPTAWCSNKPPRDICNSITIGTRHRFANPAHCLCRPKERETERENAWHSSNNTMLYPTRSALVWTNGILLVAT